MCGRFTLSAPPDAMAALFRAQPDNDLPPVPQYNVCPTQRVPVITSAEGVRRLRAMRWGFVPQWYKGLSDGPLIINARAEGVDKKPAFRAAIRERRCLLPVAGFYEWQAGPNNTRLPWYITRKDGEPMVFAALWQRWGDIDTVAMVTTEGGEAMAGIHDREPVILEPADWPLWLGEAGHGAAVLMKPTVGVLQSHRVSTAVNSNRAEGPELIEPIEA
jgi:putative SOS response-associated peptidase YedK